MRQKDLIERQSKILNIIISSYVGTAVPVGSRAVSKKIGLSSATVRNVMADLEEMGYITHPHTSAGRIPTDRGYRNYVESLSSLRNIPRDEARHIEQEYKAKRKNIEDLIKRTAEILSFITRQTGIVLFPKSKDSTFRHIDLVSIGKRKLLIVLITSTGMVNNFLIETRYDMDKDLEVISNLLNSERFGLNLADIKKALLNQLRQQRDSFHIVVEKASDIIESLLKIHSESELYLDGASHLLLQPEFKGRQITRLIRDVFENKIVLAQLIEEDLNEEGLKIHIGRENKASQMKDCSILTTGYRIKGDLVGRLGIIGPTRMEYDHLIPLVSYISETVSKRLSELVE